MRVSGSRSRRAANQSAASGWRGASISSASSPEGSAGRYANERTGVEAPQLAKPSRISHRVAEAMRAMRAPCRVGTEKQADRVQAPRRARSRPRSSGRLAGRSARAALDPVEQIAPPIADRAAQRDISGAGAGAPMAFHRPLGQPQERGGLASGQQRASRPVSSVSRS